VSADHVAAQLNHRESQLVYSCSGSGRVLGVEFRAVGLRASLQSTNLRIQDLDLDPDPEL